MNSVLYYLNAQRKTVIIKPLYVCIKVGQRWASNASVGRIGTAFPLGQVRTYLVIALIAIMFCQTDICGSRARLGGHDQGLQRVVGNYRSLIIHILCNPYYIIECLDDVSSN